MTFARDKLLLYLFQQMEKYEKMSKAEWLKDKVQSSFYHGHSEMCLEIIKDMAKGEI